MLMWGALFDERTGLSFARVTAVISLLSICTIYILQVIKCIYSIHKASVSPGSTADHAIRIKCYDSEGPMNSNGHSPP
jgi:hypothetical protein